MQASLGGAGRSAATVFLVLAALTMAGCSAAGQATPTEAPVRAVDIAVGEQDEPVEVLVDGGAAGVDVTFREITIEPGASTGEHCHYGQLIAVVQEGELTHYSATHPGGVRTYATGESIIEGAGYPHEGRNEGDSDVVLWVTYVIPDGKPLAETDLANCDA
jgi:quercetin dioxygenase-like cupin family protein